MRSPNRDDSIEKCRCHRDKCVRGRDRVYGTWTFFHLFRRVSVQSSLYFILREIYHRDLIIDSFPFYKAVDIFHDLIVHHGSTNLSIAFLLWVTLSPLVINSGAPRRERESGFRHSLVVLFLFLSFFFCFQRQRMETMLTVERRIVSKVTSSTLRSPFVCSN